MDKEYTDEIVYVKPQAFDLGALTIMYGACTGGTIAHSESGGTGECGPGFEASGGPEPYFCETGVGAACGTGGTAAT